MPEADAGTRAIQLKVGGMSCSFCSESIRKAVGRQQGVEEVHVSLAHEEALVRFRPDQTEEGAIRDTLRSMGYTIRDPRRVRAFEEQEAATRREKRRLLGAAAFAVGVFVAMLFMWLDLWTMRVWHVWAAWAAATGVFFGLGRHIIRMAWGAARRGIANQHVLLVAGAIGGYLGGLLGTPWPAVGWWGLRGFPAFDFFGVVIFLTTYHLLSAYVSLLVRTRASESVRNLLELRPHTARVVREEGAREVPIDAVRPGDLVRIRPGERVPVDGVVVEGGGAVDEALVTGEPIPAEKRRGDEVIGGSVNQTGSLLVEVTRTGEESFLFQVARHVEEAKAMKPGIIVLVDRVLKHYVPAVLLIALGALLFWSLGWGALAGEALWLRAMYAGLSVLVMGYPCALGMATPLALIRGGGMAAERGILVRSGEAFQILGDVDTVVLDKTGTVTEGRPRVVEVRPLDGRDAEALLRYAAGAESRSEHPLARAIVERAEEQAIEPPTGADFQAIPGGGVEARVGGQRVLIGTPALLEDRGVDVSGAEEALERQESKGRTVVLVAIDGALAGLMAIADEPKRDAREALARMHAMGLTTIMLTGDAERTALAIAREVGIEDVRARMLPDEKAARIRELQAEGRRVTFVGDGINDAPALMQADIGMAIGAGTDIAMESSDVILIGERLGAVLDAFEIGGRSYSKTVQNLWLAFVFNGVGVPLAATGLVHPVWAMAAMAASVTAVLLNSFGGQLLPPAPTAGATGTPARPPAGRGAPAGPDGPDGEMVREPVGTVILEVPDMHCAGCENRVTLALASRDGIGAVDVDAAAGRVRVRFRPQQVGLEDIENAVAAVGFPVRGALRLDAP